MYIYNIIQTRAINNIYRIYLCTLNYIIEKLETYIYITLFQ